MGRLRREARGSHHSPLAGRCQTATSPQRPTKLPHGFRDV
jgi:hypothetical protein